MENNISLKKTVRSFAARIEETRDILLSKHQLDINEWFNGEFKQEQLTGIISDLNLLMNNISNT